MVAIQGNIHYQLKTQKYFLDEISDRTKINPFPIYAATDLNLKTHKKKKELM